MSCSYDVLEYATETNEAYTRRYGGDRPLGRAFVVGMNPGPWGMVRITARRYLFSRYLSLPVYLILSFVLSFSCFPSFFSSLLLFLRCVHSFSFSRVRIVRILPGAVADKHRLRQKVTPRQQQNYTHALPSESVKGKRGTISMNTQKRKTYSLPRTFPRQSTAHASELSRMACQ